MAVWGQAVRRLARELGEGRSVASAGGEVRQGREKSLL